MWVGSYVDAAARWKFGRPKLIEKNELADTLAAFVRKESGDCEFAQVLGDWFNDQCNAGCHAALRSDCCRKFFRETIVLGNTNNVEV